MNTYRTTWTGRRFMLFPLALLGLVLAIPAHASAAGPFMADCDGDGFDDAEEIAMGMESDYNDNGIPDACEPVEFALVPQEFATIQAAVDGGGGRIILIAEGEYEGNIHVNGTARDLRGRSAIAPPVLTANIASGTILTLSNGGVTVYGIIFESALTGIDVNAGSSASLYSCILRDNAQAVSVTDASLQATDTDFIGNTGLGGGGAAVHAGRSGLVLNRCEFVGNGGNSLPFVSDHEGGAIRMVGISGSTLLALDCLFDDNEARVEHDQIASGFEASAFGGAIYASELHESLTIHGCTFSNNRAFAALAEGATGNAGVNHAGGGAVYVGWVDGSVSITQCTFSNNVVEVLRPDITEPISMTGADLCLFGNFGTEAIVLENTSFSDSASIGRLMDGTATSNQYCPSVTITGGESLAIVALQMTNTARGGLNHSFAGAPTAVTIDQSSFISSGFVNLEGFADSSVSNSVFSETGLSLAGDVSGCSFQGSPEEYPGLPAARLWGSNRILANSTFHQISSDAAVVGGSSLVPLFVVGTTICGNAGSPFYDAAAWVDGGGNMIEGGIGGAAPCPSGSVRVVGGQYNTISDAVTAAMNGDTILLNAALYNESIDLRGFAAITIKGAGTNASGIAAPAGQPGLRTSTGQVFVKDLAIINSSPGIESSGGFIALQDVKLKTNTSTCGGAMHLTGDAIATVSGSSLLSNSASGNGGAVCLQDQSGLTLFETTVSGNTAQGHGGGIHADDGILGIVIEACTVSSNIAFGDGGGASIGESLIVGFESSTFSSNTAGGSGGGVSVVRGVFDTCLILSNTADAVGGGVQIKGLGVIDNCQFQANVAGVGGGLAASAVETIVRDFVACGNLGGDWYGNVIDDEGVALFCSADCNGNGVDDAAEIASGDAEDCNENSIPDECEDLADLDNNGIPDACDPTEGGALVFSDVQTIGGYPSSVNDILLRPLFRDGEKTMDILLLDPAEDGAILTIDPDATKGLLDGEYLGGASFERCCTGGATPACLNNGPAGGASLAWARGDIILPHTEGDTGLFDESFEMYFGCATGSGAGDPESITDYDLAPDSALVKSLFHLQLPEDGLAEAGVSTSKFGSHVLIALPLSNGGAPPATSGRRGSGTGGTGPYPGVDQIDSFSTSFEAMDLADFDGDGHDDMVLMHSTIDRISIRNFTGLADYIDEESGETVPSGATWTAPTWIWLGWTPVAMVAGDFIDLPGVADDDLSDIVFVRGDLKDNRLVLMAATGPNSFVQIAGDAWAGGDAPFALSTTKVDLLGNEVAVLACGPSDGIVSLRAFWYDQVNEQTESQSIPLQQGDVVGISTAPKRFGASPRESIGVLVKAGAQTVVHVVELSLRPHVVPLVADINGDGAVDGADLAMLLGGWGTQGASDINNDGTTNGADLAMLLGAWTG